VTRGSFAISNAPQTIETVRLFERAAGSQSRAPARHFYRTRLNQRLDFSFRYELIWHMTIHRSRLKVWLCLAMPVLLAELAEAPAASASGDDATRAAIQRAVDAVYPALVRIHVVMEEGDNGRMQKRRGTGSGTIISEEVIS